MRLAEDTMQEEQWYWVPAVYKAVHVGGRYEEGRSYRGSPAWLPVPSSAQTETLCVTRKGSHAGLPLRSIRPLTFSPSAVLCAGAADAPHEADQGDAEEIGAD